MTYNFKKHPLSANYRALFRRRLIFVVCLVVTAASIVLASSVRKENQPAFIFYGGGRIEIGELDEVHADSPLLDNLARFYTQVIIDYDQKYKDGILRADIIPSISNRITNAEVKNLRENTKQRLSRSKASQFSTVDSVEMRRIKNGFEATVHGTISIGSAFATRTYTDEFALIMELDDAYAADLSDAEPGFLRRLFGKTTLPSNERTYPFIITKITLLQENIQ